MDEGFSRLESSVRWGFDTVTWHAMQQTDTLRSIDQTLKTPTQTQANEWRTMADTLRERGALDKAAEFYVKSVEANPLDYRAYIGYSNVLLQQSKVNGAIEILEESLPHAPQGSTEPLADWRTFSLQLIAHALACTNRIDEAKSQLVHAVNHSPRYIPTRYDLAIVEAELGREDLAIRLISAVARESELHYELVSFQTAFDRIRAELVVPMNAAFRHHTQNAVVPHLKELKTQTDQIEMWIRDSMAVGSRYYLGTEVQNRLSILQSELAVSQRALDSISSQLDERPYAEVVRIRQNPGDCVAPLRRAVFECQTRLDALRSAPRPSVKHSEIISEEHQTWVIYTLVTLGVLIFIIFVVSAVTSQ